MLMRLFSLAVVAAAGGLLHAQEHPLLALPYTPSLETKFLDRTIDPCVDFYHFACGNWNHLNPIPADQEAWNVYAKLTDENNHLLWGILQAAAKGDGQRSANEQKIGDLYGSCMDEGVIERAGLKPLQPLLQSIGQLKSKREIAALAAREHAAGMSGDLLFGFGSEQDYDDSSKVIAEADAGGLGLPDRDYYTKSDPKSVETRQRYLAHVAQMFTLLGDAPPAAKAHAEQVMKIETVLAAASLTRVEKRNPHNLKHKLTREQLQASSSFFDWSSYLTAIAPPSFTTVNVTEPKFFAQLNTELQSEDLASWKAYLTWHLLHGRAALLPAAFDQENFSFYGRYLRGVQQQRPRWKRCTQLVNRQLGEALGQVFVARTFSPKTKVDAQTMVKQIEASMEEDLRTLQWMSDGTKQRALDKLHGIANKIGYPDRWRDYTSIRIVTADLIGNMDRTSHFEFRRDLDKIGKPLDRNEWAMTPSTVNAYYNPQMNDINFPAGVLEPPLFDPKMDDAPNYGNTGATVGHELTHAFDDEGRQFDAQGNLKDWWTSEDAQKFEGRVACVRDQYSKYKVVDDIYINSQLTLGEDVADLGGTLLAYMAWKHATARQQLSSVDGLSPEQRYFVGMAQWACGDQRPESKRLHAQIDPHSPDEFRINGVVSDLPEFGTAFACHAGQPMQREHACRVW